MIERSDHDGVATLRPAHSYVRQNPKWLIEERKSTFVTREQEEVR
jgi:hypothetical protein